MSPVAQCRARDPRTCPYHGALLDANAALDKSDFDAYTAAMLRASKAQERNSQNIPEDFAVQKPQKKTFGYLLSKIFKTNKPTTPETEKLKLKASSLKAALALKGYFDEQQLSGVLDYNNLDENSYLEFGFQPLDSGTSRDQTRASGHLRGSTTMKCSGAELKALSKQEACAIRMFTAATEFNWVNKALYRGNSLEAGGAVSRDYFNFDPTEYAWSISSYSTDRNKALLTKMTGYLDSALAKGPRKQRTVYRGLSSNSKVFGKTKAEGGESTRWDRVNDWTSKNISLGQEMVFDGYQSSSLDPDIATNNYAGNDGLLFEIKTAEGINATAVSEYAHESEVLLPRGARYTVVGIHKGINMGYSNNLTVVQLVAITDEGAITDETHVHTPPPLTEKQTAMKKKSNARQA